MDLFAQADSEIARIDEQIVALQKRKAELRQFMDLGAKLFSSERFLEVDDVFPKVVTAGGRGAMGASFRLSNAHLTAAVKERQTQKAIVVTRAKEYIELFGAAKTRDLIEYIEGAGHKIGGTDKTLTVSSILSKSEEFVSDRKDGWSLKAGPKEETPQDVGASAGSDLWVEQPALPVEGTGTTPGGRGKEGTDDA